METTTPAGTTVATDTDVQTVDELLAMLGDGQLAARIAKAARLAMVKHMEVQAQEIQSAVEAENSTK